MAHVLILGMTESGKTTLAKKLSRSYKANEIGVLVLDPLRDPDWNADYIAADPESFLRVFWQSRCCMAFIDEAGESVGRYDTAMLKTATRGRHWGHSCHYLAQRATLVSQTVRDQCRHLYLFNVSTQDATILAREWNRPEIMQASKFKQGEYLHCSRYGEFTRGNIFTGEKINERNESDDEGANGGGAGGSVGGRNIHDAKAREKIDEGGKGSHVASEEESASGSAEGIEGRDSSESG